ncbi:MAG: metallophosphoesterase [Polyangiaceae bacterium]|nr:metallophosphoesterase [Polyangiaceae bacterium]
MRFGMFFTLVSLLLVAASFYVGRRAKQAFGFGRRAEIVGIAILIGSIVAMLIARKLHVRPIGQVAFTITLAILLTTVLLLLVDLVKLGIRLPLLLTKTRPSQSEAAAHSNELATAPVPLSAPIDEDAAEVAPRELPKQEVLASDPLASTRRVFLGQAVTGSAMVLGSGSSVYGALFGRLDYTVEEVPIRIPGMSRKLDGYTIVQLSDIHFGVYVGEAEMRAAEDLVRKARPDKIVLTGDLVDNNARYAEMLGRLVRRLSPLSRDGVVVIPGNHDWSSGIDATMGAAQEGGARVLRNDGLVIGSDKDGIALLGVEDVWARRRNPNARPDLDMAISRVPVDLPRVLLCHNPVFFPEAAGKVALQLSGHTHGGQIGLGPLRPIDLVLPYGYVAGRYERDGSQLYVNRGFGTAGPPARLGSPPEVTRIVLVAG